MVVAKGRNNLFHQRQIILPVAFGKKVATEQAVVEKPALMIVTGVMEGDIMVEIGKG